MPEKNLLIIGLIFLSLKIYNFQNVNDDEISYNYVFDYHSNIETKNSSNDYVTLISYNGKIETSSYLLTDKQELLLLKLNIYKAGTFLNETHSVTGIVIRQNGLVEKIIIDESTSPGMINLLKGVVNLIDNDKSRENKTESDIGGECSVTYDSINPIAFRKEKSQCNTTIVFSLGDDEMDSFSLNKESKINIFYAFSNDGSLFSLKSVETHFLEPVLFHDLIQEYKSTSTIIFNKVTKSRSMIGSVSLNEMIRTVFGNNYREIFLISIPENMKSESENTKSIISRLMALIKSQKKSNRSQVVLKMIKLFRKITKKSVLTDLIKVSVSEMEKEVIHDAAINCGSKICSEIVLIELDRCAKKDEHEANRMLLLLQNVRLQNEFIVKHLWERLPNLSEDLYQQAIQTLSTLLDKSRNSKHIAPTIKEVSSFIKTKISSCESEHCVLVHLSAIKNSRMPVFQKTLNKIIEKAGNYSNKVVAEAFSTIWVLRYSEENLLLVQNDMFDLVKSRINFYDPFVQYQSVYCLVMLQINTDQLISLLNSIQISSPHYRYFLMKKINELVNLGVINISVLESKFFFNSQHLFLTYSERDGSKMVVKPLFVTDNSLVDIHFNIIGSDGGIIKHSITDLFIVSTAQENNVFSLSTHMNGLQSLVGSDGVETSEDIEGLLQLSLFGKISKPIKLFHGTAELMSALWNAPSDLKSVLRGTFLPIDSQNEIHFQNGVVLVSNYMASAYFEMSFQLSSSIWYKTADSLLRTTGKAFVKMESKLISLYHSADTVNQISIKTGLDFETNIDFGNSPMKNCLSLSRPLSSIQIKSNIFVNENMTDHFSRNMKITGQCYSISKKMDQLCASF